MPAMLPQVRAGKVKALGMASDKRIAIAPEVPTLIEQGVQVVGGTWVALLAPAGTPKAIVDKLSGAAGAAMRRPEIKERLAQFGIEPVGTPRPSSLEFLKKEVAKWAKVIKTPTSGSIKAYRDASPMHVAACRLCSTRVVHGSCPELPDQTDPHSRPFPARRLQ